jgi:hypothetical protein
VGFCKVAPEMPKPYKRHAPDPREIQFLAAYYAKESPSFRQGAESARLAGYAEGSARLQADKILRRYGDLSIGASLKAVGIDNPYLAWNIREIIDNAKDPRDRLAAIKLASVINGDISEGGSKTTINAAGPVMIVQGLPEAGLKRLKRGQVELPPAGDEHERCEIVQDDSPVAAGGAG